MNVLCCAAMPPSPAAPGGDDRSAPDAQREIFLALTYRCPKGAYRADCPFRCLNGLSHSSRADIYDRGGHTSLASFFKLVPECACPENPEQLPPAPAPA